MPSDKLFYCCSQFYLPFRKSTKVVLRPYTLYPIPYTLDPKPKKGSKFEPFSPQRLYKMSRKNITRSCDVCAFLYRSTNGPLRFSSRIAEPGQWPPPACTATGRCVRVLSALSAHNLSHLHHPSVKDQDASNIRAAALRSLRSERHSLAAVSSCSKEHPPRCSTGSDSVRRIFGHSFGG